MLSIPGRVQYMVGRGPGQPDPVGLELDGLQGLFQPGVSKDSLKLPSAFYLDIFEFQGCCMAL